MGSDYDSLSYAPDLQSVYEAASESLPTHSRVIVQRMQCLNGSDSLFYTPVIVNGCITVKAMLDTGSMACTMSESVEKALMDAACLDCSVQQNVNIVLIGCGGKRVHPKGVCDVQLEVYGCKVIVPTLVVPGQEDELIIGTNVIKFLTHKLKATDKYWEMVSQPSCHDDGGCDDFLAMLAGVSRWRGENMPDIIGTAKLNRAVTLLPGHEHLVWGKLPDTSRGPSGCTVMVEPTKSRSFPRNVLVGRVVTPLWGDGWIPMKIINPTDKPIVIRKNAKVADVYPCLALEDVDVEDSAPVKCNSQCVMSEHVEMDPDFSNILQQHGLSDLDLNSCEVSHQWKNEMCKLVLKYSDIFSKDRLDCGEVKDFVHRIHLVDMRPFRLPYRRIPPAHFQKLRVVLNEMEERGIIRKSTSEFASPLVLVWKKNGNLRLCTDFRWLNARTVKDAHPLPHQSDCLAALGGNALFSTMDLTSGFYNIPLHENDKKFTAFSSPVGLHEYNRLPQGLCNSPASFMRMMMNIFGDQNFLSLLCYLDDLMIFAPDELEALKRLEMVFERLRAHNLKLAPKKCHLLRRSVHFLGHVIDSSGVSTDPAKVEAVAGVSKADLMCTDGVTPDPKKIQSFLGLVMWYQRFIPNCSTIAKPLFQLTSGPNTNKRRGNRSKKRRENLHRKLTTADWTPDCEKSLQSLKNALLANVVLAHPDFSKPFILSTDASTDGLGAVLSQVVPGEDKARPIAFASKTLNKAQSNYPAHRLEFLALKWAVCEKFSHWLKGHAFTAWTDNNPLTHILTKPKLDACEQRWVAKLAAYDFDLKYVPGPRNTVADALSREPFAGCTIGERLLSEPYDKLLRESEMLSSSEVQNVFRWSNVHQGTQKACVDGTSPSGCFVSSDEVAAILGSHTQWDVAARVRATALTNYIQSATNIGQDALPSIPKHDLVGEQRADPELSRVIFYVERRRRPTRRERPKEPLNALKLLKQWDKLAMDDGILYRVSRDPVTRGRKRQFIVPLSLQREVLWGCHDETGHQGQDRTLHLVKQRFYWSTVERDVRNYVKCCSRCVLSKTPEPEGRAPLESIKTTAPLQLVCIDFWTAEDSRNRPVDVLVITDHFTKLAHAFHCPDQTAKQVAKKLWDNFFCYYGFPETIHTDQGANFESELVAALLQLSGVKKSRTTAYHPMGNGTAERFNRTLGNMIRALPPRSKHTWPQMLHTLTFMYNSTVHETTGFPPFYLMFGRVPRLPVGVLFKSALSSDTAVSYPKFLEDLRRDLREAMVLAEKRTTDEQRRQANYYNRRIKGMSIELGDRVLLANKAERGRKKLADRWEDIVYTVIECNPKTHTYRIRNPVTGQSRVVHRNLLLGVNFLPALPVGVDDFTSIVSSVTSVDEGDASTEQHQREVLDKAARTEHWVSRIPVDETPQYAGLAPTMLPDEDGSGRELDSAGVDVWDVSAQHSKEGTVCPLLASSVAHGVLESVQSLPDTHSTDHSVSCTSEISATTHAIDCTSAVRTRAGRLVRPVSRLTYTVKNHLVHTGQEAVLF